MKVALCMIYILGSFLTYSQNAKDEIININKAFKKSGDVALETITKSFTEGNTKPQKETKTELYRTKDNYLIKTDASETLINKRYKINVDVKKKIIIIYNLNPNKPKQTITGFDEKAFSTSMDTVLTLYKEVKVNKVDENTNQIEFIFKSGAYNNIKVSYDKTTYVVKEYNIHLNPTEKSIKEKGTSRQQIIYNYFSKDKLQKKWFDESNYIIIHDKNIVPANKYKGFKVINNTKK